MSKMYDCLMIVMLSAQVRHNILHLWLAFLGFKLEMHVLRVILEFNTEDKLTQSRGVNINWGNRRIYFGGSLISRAKCLLKGGYR